MVAYGTLRNETKRESMCWQRRASCEGLESFLYLLISLHSLTDQFSRQYPILQTTKFKRLFWILFVKAKHC